MKNKGRLLFFVLFFAGFLAHSSVAWAQVPGVSKDGILVGAIVDKSGPVIRNLAMQTYGQMAYFQKAYEEGIYKRKITLITEDGAYDPSKHLAAAKLLLDRDKVFCLINSVGTSPTLALNCMV